jgi:hypothetical protein
VAIHTSRGNFSCDELISDGFPNNVGTPIAEKPAVTVAFPIKLRREIVFDVCMIVLNITTKIHNENETGYVSHKKFDAVT